MNVVAAVRRAIKRYELLNTGDRLVVGVSGGPDSLCLLHVLLRLQEEWDLQLHVAHLNHRMRGEEAEADAAFVADLAYRWGLPVTVGARDVPALARTHRLSLEEAARQARYTFLAEVAAQVGADKIAVGHNADDQVETVVMHWLRGAGPAGLRGMLPKTMLSHYHLLGEAPSGGLKPGFSMERAGPWLIRPLLGVPRTEIEAYCREHGLQPRFDRSNLDTTYYRNRLRHELLPLLETYNARIREVLWRSAEVMAGDVEVLRLACEAAWARTVQAESDEAVVFDRTAWAHLPIGLQRGLLRSAVVRLRHSLRDVPYEVIENAVEVAARGSVGAQASLPAGLTLSITYDRLIVAGPGVAGPPPDWPLLYDQAPVPVAVPGITPLGEWQLEARVLPPDGWERTAVELNPDPWQAYLDYQVVQRMSPGALYLRRRQPGDRFRPLGLGGHRTRVSQLLINLKVPRPWRDAIPLLVAGDTILWVCGFRLDEAVRVTEHTQEVLHLRFNKVDDGR